MPRLINLYEETEEGFVKDIEDIGYTTKVQDVEKGSSFYRVKLTLDFNKFYVLDDILSYPTSFHILPIITFKLNHTSKLFFVNPGDSHILDTNYNKYINMFPNRSIYTQYNAIYSFPSESLELTGRYVDAINGRVYYKTVSKEWGDGSVDFNGEKYYFLDIGDGHVVTVDMYIPIPELFLSNISRNGAVTSSSIKISKNTVLLDSIGFMFSGGTFSTVAGYTQEYYMNYTNEDAKYINIKQTNNKAKELMQTAQDDGSLIFKEYNETDDGFNGIIAYKFKNFTNEGYLFKNNYGETDYIQKNIKVGVSKYVSFLKEYALCSVNIPPCLGIDFYNNPFYYGAFDTQYSFFYTDSNSRINSIERTNYSNFAGYPFFAFAIDLSSMKKITGIDTSQIYCNYLGDLDRCLQNFDPSIDYLWTNRFYYGIDEEHSIIFGTGAKDIPLEALININDVFVLGLLSGFGSLYC